MDPRTREYIRALISAQEANSKAVEAAEQICTCESCIEARARKQVSACEQAKILSTMHDKIIEPMPGYFAPELSPNYFDFQSGKRRSF